MIMEKHRYGFVLIFSIIDISLGLVSFVSCFVAEIKKAKRKDLKWDGKLCYLPGSRDVFGLGIAALLCLCIAQIIGNLVICRSFCSRDKTNRCKTKVPAVARALLVFSWISFGVAVILISTATSMSRRQPYGDGWVNGKCYLVKDGIFMGSGVLVLVIIGAMVGAAVVMIKKTQVEQQRKVHAQVV